MFKAVKFVCAFSSHVPLAKWKPSCLSRFARLAHHRPPTSWTNFRRGAAHFQAMCPLQSGGPLACLASLGSPIIVDRRLGQSFGAALYFGAAQAATYEGHARSQNDTAPLQKFFESIRHVKRSSGKQIEQTRSSAHDKAAPIRQRGPGTMLSGFRGEVGISTFQLSS